MIHIPTAFAEHRLAIDAAESLVPAIEEAARWIAACLASGGKVLWMGNGGSAADSQHLAAELVGRYRRERRGLASIALTTDTSVLTAIGNDYGFDRVFERQIEALCHPDDVVVGLTTSGNSPNVVTAIRRARGLGAFTIGLTGGDGGALRRECDLCLTIPSNVTARTQEAHILIGHILCDWAEADVVARGGADVPLS